MSNEYEDIISWSNDHYGFVVKNPEKFQNTVLPKFFKHNKFTSFVRQLNMYDFHKLRHKGEVKEFKHIYFCKHRPDLLHQIKRKTPEQVEANDKKVKDALQVAEELKKLEEKNDESSRSAKIDQQSEATTENEDAIGAIKNDE